MTTQTPDYRWLPPALIANLLLNLSFTIWGWAWSTVLASITFLILSTTIAFVMQHWGHLPVFATANSFDESADNAQEAVTNWWKRTVVSWWDRNTDLFIVLGIDLIGVIGMVFVAIWGLEKEDFIAKAATWGGHDREVMVIIALGICASIVGVIRHRYTGREND